MEEGTLIPKRETGGERNRKGRSSISQNLGKVFGSIQRPAPTPFTQTDTPNLEKIC